MVARRLESRLLMKHPCDDHRGAVVLKSADCSFQERSLRDPVLTTELVVGPDYSPEPL